MAASASLQASANDPLRPRSFDASLRGAALALLAHLLLVGSLSLAVSWRLTEPEGGEAELWAAIPQAAPPAPTHAEPDEPPPVPQPANVQPAEPEAPPQPAQIAIQKAPPPKPKPKPQPKPKPEAKPAPPPESKPKPTTKPKPSAAELAAQARIEENRRNALARMMAGAGGSDSASGSPNVGARGAALSKSYGAKVAAAIKRNLIFPDALSGNPEAVVSVRCSPTGRILSRRMVQPSGAPAWDDAVLRAIDRTETLPLNDDGTVPSSIEIAFRPRDL